jgi:putative ubiquitin-RnfH superfamily antitoxin RatB of RatAB toxin-antitoxin module
MTIRVEVVYALPQAQTEITVDLPAGAVVQEALDASGIFGRHPEIDAGRCPVGVWGRVAERSQVLRDRDRVEIYRPLQADPKQVRRDRAQRERKQAQRRKRA